VSPPVLRPMRWWDVADAEQVERAVFAAEPWSEAGFWSELAHVPATRYYVVLDDGGQVVGYAGLSAVGAEADVQTVAVRPDRQGQGLGRVLVEARRRRCHRVMLEVRDENEAARALYEQLGFEEVGVRRGYYGPGADAVVMRCTLAGDGEEQS
jgi:[ribosomal protein S18]-alanine N-acetyltransferase